jgi:hypothetical protein
LLGFGATLRFFFTVTLDRPDLSRRFVRVRYPLKLPTVLNVEEVGRLLEMAPGPKYGLRSARPMVLDYGYQRWRPSSWETSTASAC